MRSHIIVADENIPFLSEFFSPYGEIRALPGRAMRAEDVQDADILLVRSVTAVNANLLQNSAVKFVGTCTIGVDHIDQNYLQQRQICMASAPGCNAGGVVQYVLSALAKLQPQWRTKKIGIVGCGNVGGRLYAVLAAAGVDVVAFDPYKTRPGVRWAQWDEVLACDILCLHTPLTRTGTHPTWHLFDETAINRLQPGTLLLNAGRGGVVDNQALLARLERNNDLQVVLDVWENEPDILVPLLQKIALGTPHIAGYSYEGRVNGSTMIHQALAEFLSVPEAQWRAHEQRVMREALGESACLHFTDINSSLLDIYDVTADDAAMRALAMREGTTAQGFDVLRKNYPKRRELSHFRVSPEHAMAGVLKALGFEL
jgi:erythronate-4-phosphate dehydrogenase